MKLGHSVSFVSRRSPIEGETSHENITSNLKLFNPDIILICTETSKHDENLKELLSLGYEKDVYIEKPLFLKPEKIDTSQLSNISVLYNLRGLKEINFIRNELNNEKILKAKVYCGQYLPQWREGRDYRDTYSSDVSKSGGVLADLSHEIDYSILLFGKIKTLTALGSKVSDLELGTDDTYDIHAQTDRGVELHIHVNYVDKVPTRYIELKTQNNEYKIDIINGKVLKNNEESAVFEKADTYLLQAEKIINNDTNDFCSYDDGLYINQVIVKALESNRLKKQVTV